MTRTFSFKPTFDSLDAREMMDAGIGGALMSNLVHTPDTGMPITEQLRALDSTTTFESIDVRATPQVAMPLAAQASRTGAPVTQAAVNKVTEEAWRLLKDKIIGNGLNHGQFSNSWGLFKDGRESLIKTEVVGQEIRLTFSVYYRNVADPAKVQLNFTGKFENGAKIYRLTGAGLHDYKDFLWGTAGAFENSAKSDFRNNYRDGIRVEVAHPDVNKFAESIAKQAAQVFGHSPYKVKGVELFDGGIRVVLERGERIESDDPQRIYGQDHRYSDRYALEFTYSDSDLKAGIVSLDRVEKYSDKSWRHSATYRDYPWNNDGRVEQSWSAGEQETLRSVRWTPTIS